MSIENEILRIQKNIADTYTVVADKGGDVPNIPTVANLADAVRSIPQTTPPPDNNPIGTIIIYMGTSAPKDYLICDGSELNISDYSELALFFEDQFGSSNYFGGDGETTFAVPDMRNLFLRGYHGESENQLSGDIGKIQNATQHISWQIANQNKGLFWSPNSLAFGDITTVVDEDKVTVTRNIGWGSISAASTGNTIDSTPSMYTSRPVNMAVLYCIKAITAESSPDEESYSTEETRIGTWIDGSSVYRRVFETAKNITGNSYEKIIDLPDDIDQIVSCTGMAIQGNGYQLLSNPGIGCSMYVDTSSSSNYINGIFLYFGTNNTGWRNSTFRFILEYTKISS